MKPADARLRFATGLVLGVAGIAVLAVAFTLAYLEMEDRGQTAAFLSQVADAGTVRSAADAKGEKPALAFNFHDQPRPVPAIRFTDDKDRAMTLENFRGKAVLLNIWATWCVPCRKEMPALDRLQAKIGGPAFQVVALSVDQGGLGAVRPFYKEIGIRSLDIFVDRSSEALSALAVVGLPTTLLIDERGREIGRKIGPAEWDSQQLVDLIRSHLKAPVPNRRAEKS